MGYQLGVDLGTTYTAAAVGHHGRVEVCTLGASSPVMPSVVLLRADGEVLEGEVAVRRGLAEPTRVAREFKRRLGDPTPLVLGGTPYGAESLMSHLLRAVVRITSEREGEAPERVVLTHPANYGPYKLDMMREVARLAGLDLASTSFLTEPQAAAISYASRNRVDPGQVVAVYDFGGGTFDAALVQRTDTGFSLIGRPEGMERFGGIDIDAAIVSHVDHVLGGAISAMSPDDPAVQAGVARLRDDCREAKEALSGDTDTSIAVALPNLQTQVRLTRAELEEMVRPRLRETLEALERAVRSANLTIDQVSRVLLVGGSSRIPLVAEMIQRETGRPVAVDAHPKFAIALGAAAWGQSLAGAPGAAPTAPPPVAPPVAPPGSATSGVPTGPPSAPPPPGAPPSAAPPPPTAPPAAGAPPAAAPPPAGPPTATPAAARADGPPRFQPSTAPATPDRRKLYVILGAVAALIVGVVAVIALSGGGGDSSTDTTRPRRTDPVDTVDTVAPTTVDTGPVVTGEQVRASLLTLADLEAGWVESTFTDGGDEVCGELPVTQPAADQTVVFDRFVDTPNAQSLLHTVSVFRSADDADQNFEQGISIGQNCVGDSQVINGITFNLTYLVQRLDPNLVAGLSPSCEEGALFLVSFTDASTGTVQFTANIDVVRCANVITSVSVQAAATADPSSFNAQLASAITVAAQKAAQLPLRT